jgi:hypothetical protein
MTVRAMGALACACALLAGAPAAALESLTGTYDGKLSCRRIDSGVADKFKQDISVEVVDAGVDGVRMDFVGFSELLVGFAVADASKEKSGKVNVVSCELNAFDQIGAVVHADASTKSGSDKATLKGTLIRMDDDSAEATICTFTVKRSTTAEPAVNDCVL